MTTTSAPTIIAYSPPPGTASFRMERHEVCQVIRNAFFFGIHAGSTRLAIVDAIECIRLATIYFTCTLKGNRIIRLKNGSHQQTVLIVLGVGTRICPPNAIYQ